MGIVGIVVSGVLTVFLNVITINKDSEFYSQAYKIADSELEKLRGASFDSIANSTNPITALPQGEVVVAVSNTIDGAPQADIKKVDLKLRWNFRKQREIRLVTLIARNGIVQ